MMEAGILTSDSRVELIDGEIFTMPPIGPPQGSFIGRLQDFFVRQVPESLHCRIQLPIVIADHSEPEPDVAIVRHRDDYYQHEHPTPADVVQLIEVAQSSIKRDLGRKLRVYAKSRISEYWVIDVDQKSVRVHRNPTGARYQDVETFAVGGTIAPAAVPECRLDLAWLFR
jgi:Uma2 family endonuclease